VNRSVVVARVIAKAHGTKDQNRIGEIPDGGTHGITASATPLSVKP
jgi:hypothetical protein